MKVTITCHNGHINQWNSQPLIKQTPAGNLLIASAILFSGNSFSSVNSFAECLGVKFIKERRFHDLQKIYLCPIVNAAWIEEENNVLALLKAKDTVNLNGDGRCDSPGHKAKYGTLCK